MSDNARRAQLQHCSHRIAAGQGGAADFAFVGEDRIDGKAQRGFRAGRQDCAQFDADAVAGVDLDALQAVEARAGSNREGIAEIAAAGVGFPGRGGQQIGPREAKIFSFFEKGKAAADFACRFANEMISRNVLESPNGVPSRIILPPEIARME